MNEYTGNSCKACVLEFDLEYSKELRELYNDYPLAPNKIEINREMLSGYHLKPYAIFLLLMPKNLCLIFCKEMYVFHYENLQLYWSLALKFKNMHRLLEFNQSQWSKPYIEFNKHTKIEAR